MNSQEFEIALKEKGERFVYNSFLMNEDVYILKQIHKEKAVDIYHKIKITASEILEISVKNIAIVGSAKTGYSLTPGKDYSAFSEKSDLDLIVVSNELFHELWKGYLKFVNSFTGSEHSYSGVAKNIFKHFISIKTEKITGDQLQIFNDWISKVDRLKKELQLNYQLPSEINYRVYESWEYVEQYHISGLKKLKR